MREKITVFINEAQMKQITKAISPADLMFDIFCLRFSFLQKYAQFLNPVNADDDGNIVASLKADEEMMFSINVLQTSKTKFDYCVALLEGGRCVSGSYEEVYAGCMTA